MSVLSSLLEIQNASFLFCVKLRITVLSSLLSNKIAKGLEILLAVVFCNEFVLPVQGGFLFCEGRRRMKGELVRRSR